MLFVIEKIKIEKNNVENYIVSQICMCDGDCIEFKMILVL